MRHMVAQARVTGYERGRSHATWDREQVVQMLRAGHTVAEVAFACEASTRQVRRIGRRAGLL